MPNSTSFEDVYKYSASRYCFVHRDLVEEREKKADDFGVIDQL